MPFTFVQSFESSLAKRENYIKELEKELSQLKDVNNRQRDEIEHLNDKLVSEARRMKSLERDSDRLRSEISLLESKVLNCSTLLKINSLTFLLKIEH